MKLEELIGANLARLREARGMSQAQVGDALSGYLDKPWSRQAVSAAEKGRRAFTAAELLSLALSLRVSVIELLLPSGEENLFLAGGAEITYDQYRQAILAEGGSDRGKELADTVSRLQARVYKLAVTVATGAPPYESISEVIGSGDLPIELSVSLAQIRSAFAKSVPAAGGGPVTGDSTSNEDALRHAVDLMAHQLLQAVIPTDPRVKATAEKVVHAIATDDIPSLMKEDLALPSGHTSLKPLTKHEGSDAEQSDQD
jgi:transcriptional regulator with XRE-family HTH domain